MRWRNGNRKCPRRIDNIPDVTFYKPAGIPLREIEIVEISIVEIEALRLSDLEGLTQEEASQKMGISRRSYWDDLKTARKKIAHALSTGCAIQIVGGKIARQSTSDEEIEEK